jgi:hypothetical protein
VASAAHASRNPRRRSWTNTFTLKAARKLSLKFKPPASLEAWLTMPPDGPPYSLLRGAWQFYSEIIIGPRRRIESYNGNRQGQDTSIWMTQARRREPIVF